MDHPYTIFMTKPYKKKYRFTEEGIKNIIALAKTLKRIHIRLIKEGYIIKDGQIIEPKRKTCTVDDINAIKNRSHEKKQS